MHWVTEWVASQKEQFPDASSHIPAEPQHVLHECLVVFSRIFLYRGEIVLLYDVLNKRSLVLVV